MHCVLQVRTPDTVPPSLEGCGIVSTSGLPGKGPVYEMQVNVAGLGSRAYARGFIFGANMEETANLVFLHSEWMRLRFGDPLKDPKNEELVLRLFGNPGGKYDKAREDRGDHLQREDG